MKRVSILLALLVAVAHSVLANSITIDFSDTSYHDSYSSSSYMSGKIDLSHWTIYYGCFNPPIISAFGYDSTKDAMKLSLGSGNEAMRVGLAVLKENITVDTNFTVTFEVMGNTNRGLFVGVLLHLKDGTTIEVTHYSGTSAKPGSHDDTTVHSQFAGADNAVRVGDLSGAITFTNFTFNPVEDAKVDPSNVKSIQIFFGGAVVGSTGTVYLKSVTIKQETKVITFSIKDALSGSGLSGVTVKEGDTVLGTIDDGGTLELAKGTHMLTFEKQGYWSVTKTIDVQNDMTVSVKLYPSSAALKFVDFPTDIKFYAGTINTLSFTIEPISTATTKNVYLSFGGLTPEKVTVDGSEVSPEGGKYYLGDVTGPVYIEVVFKAPETIGTKSFNVVLESYDLTGNTYTTTKTAVYDVIQLPFLIDWPTWTVGENRLRIVEQSGESYLIQVSVADANGSEIYADSHLFNPYESYEFAFSLPDIGAYKLTINAKNGAIVLEREISAAYPVTLETKTVTAAPGDVATIALELGNPGDWVVYYNITLSGSVLGAPVTKAVSVAPGTTKTVYIDFKVPENPEFDAYALTVEVSTSGAVVFSDTVTLTISDDGFGLGLGALSGSGPLGLQIWAWMVLGLVALVLVVRGRR